MVRAHPSSAHSAKSLFRQSCPVHRTWPIHLGVEPLEERWVPATHIWIGAASGGLWNAAGNWTNGLPTNGEAGGTILQFNGNIDSTNNLAGLVIDQLHFTSGNNSIRGADGITLGIAGNHLTNNILSDTGANTVDGSLPLNLSAHSGFVIVASGRLTLKSAIGGNQGLTLRPTTTGVLVFEGPANTYAGTTTVNAGTLWLNKYLFAAAVPHDLSIDLGATVVLLNAEQINDTANVTVKGTLDLSGRSETFDGLSGDGSVMLGGSASTVLTVGAHNGSSTFTGVISGTGNVTKAGTGSFEVAGTAANTYLGTTTVADGLLRLNKSVYDGAIPGSLQIGDGTGAAGSAEVRLIHDWQINGASAVTVRSDGLFDLNGFITGQGPLTVNGGHVIIRTRQLIVQGSLTMTGGTISVLTGGNLFVDGDVTTHASPTTATIGGDVNGTVNLNDVMRTFAIADGAAAIDLDIQILIFNTGLTKTGPGLLRLGERQHLRPGNRDQHRDPLGRWLDCGDTLP